MTPLRDTFGEEWVEMDDDEELLDGEGTIEFLRLHARAGDSQSENEERNKIDEDEDCKKASIKSHKPQNIYKNKEESLMSKCSLEREDLEEALGNKNSGLDLNEQSLEMQPSKYGMNDIAMLKEKSEKCPRQSFGWSEGRNKKTQFLKRVMSEASFMQGQVMVSKSECIQEVMSKREGSKRKEGAKGGDKPKIMSVGKIEKSEESMVEVEVTIEQWSNQKQKGIIEGEDMLLVTIPSWSMRKTHKHKPAPEAAHQQLTTSEMPPKPIRPKPDLKAVHMHQQALQALQHGPKLISEDEVPQAAQASTKGGVSKALDGTGMHADRAKPSAKTQSKTIGMAEKPPKTPQELHMEAKANQIPPKTKEEIRGRLKALEVVPMEETSLQSEQGEEKKQASAGQLEVKEVECECCGLGEECTAGYIDHVKGLFSGHWVCGLCAEAVNEERHRLGKGVPMEDAVRTHMNLCKQFSSKKKAGKPPDSPGVAHAVCHLLSRHLSDPTSPRQVTPPIRPILSRTSSCLPSFSHKPPSTS